MNIVTVFLLAFLPVIAADGPVEVELVSALITPDHTSQLWSRDVDARGDVQCPEELRVAFTHGRRDVILNAFRRRDVGVEDVPISINEGHTHSRHAPGASRCLYEDLATAAQLFLKPANDHLFLTGTFATPDGLFSLESQPEDDNQLLAVTQIATEDAAESRRTQRRRSSRGQTVELFVVFYHDMYVRYQDLAKKFSKKMSNPKEQLKYFAGSMVQEMDKMYEPLDISIKLIGIEIQTDRSKSCVERGRTNYYDLNLASVLNCLMEVPETVTREGFKPDHITFISGYDMYLADAYGRANYGYMGYAAINGICTAQASSLIENTGMFNTAKLASHELGHNLGAPHDEFTRSCRSGQHLMTQMFHFRSSDYKKNSLSFSECSKEAIRDTGASMWAGGFANPKKCLNEIANSGKTVRTKTTLPGKVFTPDEQCQIRFGTRSKHCYQASELRNICLSMRCRDIKTYQCNRGEQAAQGTKCGEGMTCQDNYCKKEV